MAIDLTFLTQAYNEGRLALAALNAGKKGTALDHAGQGISFVGKFTAAALNENLSVDPVIMNDLTDDELLAEIKSKLEDTQDVSASAISPALLLLLQLLFNRILKRLLPIPA